MGGPPGQPGYLNAVVLVDGLPAPETAEARGARSAAEALLEQLQGLEQQFGRERQERWALRCLDRDLDLLWWGDLRLALLALVLPHPRLDQRSFVPAKLMALDPQLLLSDLPTAGQSVQAALQPGLPERPPRALAMPWQAWTSGTSSG